MTRWAGLVLLLAGVLPAQVSLVADGEAYVFTHPTAGTLRVEPQGGRISSWRLTPTSPDLVALWKGGDEIGGLLDDRGPFTALRYQAAIMQPGPQTAVLRLEAHAESGAVLIKILTLTADSPALTVSWELRNGGQVPQRLWLRNMLLPGGGPQTEAHRYWVNTGPAPVADDPNAHEYYPAAEPAWAALWHRPSGEGLLVIAPGAEQFYFWRDSREFPTFEWLYPRLPAGQTMTARAVLWPVAQPGPAPDWAARAAALAALAAPARTTPLAGWVDEATRFGITAAERAQGFWLSVEAGEGKQRLPEPLAIDLPRSDERWLALTINPLADQQVPVRLTVDGAAAGVEVTRETPTADRRELLPPPAGPLSLVAGTPETWWLRVRSSEVVGEETIGLTLTVGETATPITLHRRVWPVSVPANTRPFHVRGYYSGLSALAGGYEVTDASTARLEALLAPYAAMGGDVLDWLVNWAEIVRRVRLAETGESLSGAVAENPDRIDLAHPPRLDFGYYTPWLEACRRHGVTRVETYLEPLGSTRWGWALLDPVFGKGRVAVGSAEHEQALVWWYGELRRWFEAEGFSGFFCRISDEIAPEAIPDYRRAARVARAAGWRPFTTVTGLIARTAGLINELAPDCDEWQLAFSLKDDFLTLRDRRFAMVDQSLPLAGKWLPYTNGGATATWSLRSFGPDSATGLAPEGIDSFALLEDGQPLALSGDSPWGNTIRGRVITSGRLGSTLYVSPTQGTPAEHTYTLQLRLRQESATGEPLIRLKDDDEVWCYGGGSRPYRQPYATGLVYPLMTLRQGLAGFGQWAFYWWQASERIVWIDEAGQVTRSPVYVGYRDGWREACLLALLRDRHGPAALDPILGPAGRLQVGEVQHEAYRYLTVTNADDPVAQNAARRATLEALSE